MCTWCERRSLGNAMKSSAVILYTYRIYSREFCTANDERDASNDEELNDVGKQLKRIFLILYIWLCLSAEYTFHPSVNLICCLVSSPACDWHRAIISICFCTMWLKGWCGRWRIGSVSVQHPRSTYTTMPLTFIYCMKRVGWSSLQMVAAFHGVWTVVDGIHHYYDFSNIFLLSLGVHVSTHTHTHTHTYWQYCKLEKIEL